MVNALKVFHRGFWQVADPKIWVASTVPMVLGALLAVSSGKGFSLFWLLVSFVGVYLIEIGKNAINECVDYISGADTSVDEEHRTPFSGGKKTILDGLLTVWQSALIGLFTMGLAALIGLLVVIFQEPKVMWIGFAGFILAAIYSLPPFKLCYRGFGELTVGIVFGPLIVNGMYVVMAHEFDILPLLVSIPIGMLITNVLWINQFPDYEADLNAGKRNWVVRLGKKKASQIYGFIFMLVYMSIAWIVIYTKNPIWFAGFSTIHLAWKSVANCKANYGVISKLIVSNQMTVQIYVLTGLLLGVSALIDGFIF